VLRVSPTDPLTCSRATHGNIANAAGFTPPLDPDSLQPGHNDEHRRSAGGGALGEPPTPTCIAHSGVGRVCGCPTPTSHVLLHRSFWGRETLWVAALTNLTGKILRLSLHAVCERRPRKGVVGRRTEYWPTRSRYPGWPVFQFFPLERPFHSAGPRTPAVPPRTAQNDPLTCKPSGYRPQIWSRHLAVVASSFIDESLAPPSWHHRRYYTRLMRVSVIGCSGAASTTMRAAPPPERPLCAVRRLGTQPSHHPGWTAPEPTSFGSDGCERRPRRTSLGVDGKLLLIVGGGGAADSSSSGRHHPWLTIPLPGDAQVDPPISLVASRQRKREALERDPHSSSLEWIRPNHAPFGGWGAARPSFKRRRRIRTRSSSKPQYPPQSNPAIPYPARGKRDWRGAGGSSLETALRA